MAVEISEVVHARREARTYRARAAPLTVRPSPVAAGGGQRSRSKQAGRLDVGTSSPDLFPHHVGGGMMTKSPLMPISFLAATSRSVKSTGRVGISFAW